TVSAPGKVLITGGYLVLERASSGIVLATTARFHATARLGDAVSDALLQRWLCFATWRNVYVIVESPQFHSRYVYDLTWPAGARTAPEIELPGQDSNPFLEKALVYTMAAVRASSSRRHFKRLLRLGAVHTAVAIKLRADNDFYSQTEQLRARGMLVTAENLATLAPFLPAPLTDGRAKVAKTGLGSSAALTVSLVGCLLRFLGVVELPGGPDWEDLPPPRRQNMLALVHHLSQIAHAAAQGKVGSGFDVSAAVYGSHVYTRFSPDLIRSVLDLPINSPQLPGALRRAVDAEWDSVRAPLALPPSFRLLMGDVAGGSATPGMVRAVLKWKADPATAGAAAALWRSLDDANGRAEGILRALAEAAEEAPAEFEWCVAGVARAPLSVLQLQDFARTSVQARLIMLRSIFTQIRRLLQQMGAQAGVGIEPPQQTRLLDTTAGLPGVLCAGVPGAGGADAVFAIVVHESAAAGVHELWAGWNKGSNARAAGPTAAGSVGEGGGGSDAAAADMSVCPLLLMTAGSGPEAGVAVNGDLAWR
ncbi:unnamed protein product, partial [Phaeothamnion confervicola]